MSNEPSKAAIAAADEWFAETKAFIEKDRARTGDDFANAALSSLGLATSKLASIIDRHMQSPGLVVRRDQISEINLGNNPWFKVELPTDEDYRAAVEAMLPLPERPKE